MFVDYQAFDKIPHQKMIQILRSTGMDDEDFSIIRNLHWNEEYDSLHKNQCWTKLFNLYLKEIFKEAV